MFVSIAGEQYCSVVVSIDVRWKCIGLKKYDVLDRYARIKRVEGFGKDTNFINKQNKLTRYEKDVHLISELPEANKDAILSITKELDWKTPAIC